jgi:hypothetical protein
LEGNDKNKRINSAINDLTIDESQRLQQELIELKREMIKIQKLRKEKDTKIQGRNKSMKR